MPSHTIEMKKDGTCKVHGAPSRGANRTLLVMIAASLVLIVWRVWVYGPSGHASPETVHRSFPLLVGTEIWGLLFDRHGILAEFRVVFPYFIAGVLLAGLIRTYKVAVKLQAKLRQYGIASVFLASFVGIVTPLCACGTLTTAISLLFAGIPLAPVMALLVTSPLMSPSTYLITLNDLGPEWTVIRTISAFAMGVFAGVVTHLLRDRGFRTETVFIDGAIPRGDFHDESYPDERLRCNCKEKLGNRVAARTGNLFLVFLAKSVEMLWPIGKYVVVGVAIGTVVERYVPFEWIYQLFGRKDPLNIVWITLGTIPLFLHQISASSILYHVKSSLSGTLDNGAALAFLIGGPVTAVPTMVLFWTVFKKRMFGLYLLICIAGTLLIAYTFQFLVFVPNVDTGNALLKGVRSLSGGNATIIKKLDKNVRIVMDPAGNGMIATSVDEYARRGGIVFDAGFGRIQAESSDRFDNQAYISNAADWLEQSNSSSVKTRILIYDASPRSASASGVVGKDIIAALEDQGFVIRIADRRELPHLTDALLEAYSQVWLLFGNTGQLLSENELNAVAGMVKGGKSMLIVAGPQVDAPWDPAASNRLASRFGVEFSGLVKNREELPATTGSLFLQRTSTLLGKVLKFFHKA